MDTRHRNEATGMPGGTEVPTTRRVQRVVTTAPLAPGFGGPGHTMTMVVDPAEFERQDPFILLADDHLDLAPGAPVGDEHPHAGFEIWTFVVEGALRDRDEGLLRGGDVQWMRAGRGIIHGEHIVPEPGTRILQLWVAVPEKGRWGAPTFGTIPRDDASVVREDGVEGLVYADGSARGEGTDGPLPMTVADFRLQTGAAVEWPIPAGHSGFVYVLDGEVAVGPEAEVALTAGQVGWLGHDAGGAPGIVRISAGTAENARVVLYAGAPQHAPIVTHGPFVGGSRADLFRVSRDYMDGRFMRMSELARGQAGV